MEHKSSDEDSAQAPAGPATRVGVWLVRSVNLGLITWAFLSARTPVALLAAACATGFEYVVGNHFHDAWFQKAGRVVFWVIMIFIAVTAVFTFGFLALTAVLGI